MYKNIFLYIYIFIYIYIYTRGLRISVARPQPQLGFLPADLKERQVETQKFDTMSFTTHEDLY